MRFLQRLCNSLFCSALFSLTTSVVRLFRVPTFGSVNSSNFRRTEFWSNRILGLPNFSVNFRSAKVQDREREFLFFSKVKTVTHKFLTPKFHNPKIRLQFVSSQSLGRPGFDSNLSAQKFGAPRIRLQFASSQSLERPGFDPNLSAPKFGAPRIWPLNSREYGSKIRWTRSSYRFLFTTYNIQSFALHNTASTWFECHWSNYSVLTLMTRKLTLALDIVSLAIVKRGV